MEAGIGDPSQRLRAAVRVLHERLLGIVCYVNVASRVGALTQRLREVSEDAGERVLPIPVDADQSVGVGDVEKGFVLETRVHPRMPAVHIGVGRLSGGKAPADCLRMRPIQSPRSLITARSSPRSLLCRRGEQKKVAPSPFDSARGRKGVVAWSSFAPSSFDCAQDDKGGPVKRREPATCDGWAIERGWRMC